LSAHPGIDMASITGSTRAGIEVARNAAPTVKRVAQELGALPLACRMDHEDQIVAAFAALDEAWGGVDVLINNAGIGRFEPMDQVEWAHFQEIFPTNVYGAAIAGREAVHRFKKQGKGHIINIASSAGVKGFKEGTVYAASKFALRGMTECWREELRPHNIRVMLVNPSGVPTAFNAPDRTERPLKDRHLTPAEIAYAVVSVLEMDDRGFIPELGVWATNPF
jgi:3-oxoacyl-[acyl-carrier protein] reductase